VAACRGSDVLRRENGGATWPYWLATTYGGVARAVAWQQSRERALARAATSLHRPEPAYVR